MWNFRPPLPSHHMRPSRADVVWKSAIVLGLVALVGASLRLGVPPIVVGYLRGDEHWGQGSILCALSSALVFLYGAVSFFHALRYRPIPGVTDDLLPTVSVIVPAYNEGHMVRAALLSALGSDYPREKVHVIAIDDGSTDDTWSHIAR